MASLTHLKNLTGTLTGHNSLWLEPGTPVFESDTSATISTVAGGKVVALDYTWSHEGEPHDGRILLSIDDVEGVHMAWCDSFHMDAKIMDLTGDGVGDSISATGSWTAAPDSEPWGWRIELEPHGPDRLLLRMYVILPSSLGGKEALGVQADYTRA